MASNTETLEKMESKGFIQRQVFVNEEIWDRFNWRIRLESAKEEKLILDKKAEVINKLLTDYMEGFKNNYE